MQAYFFFQLPHFNLNLEKKKHPSLVNHQEQEQEPPSSCQEEEENWSLQLQQ